MKSHRFFHRAALGLTICFLPLTAPVALDQTGSGQTATHSAPTRHAPHPAGPDLAVGDYASAAQMRVVAQPGHFGLSDAPGEDSYAVIGGQLARVNAASGQIMSILRPVAPEPSTFETVAFRQ